MFHFKQMAHLNHHMKCTISIFVTKYIIILSYHRQRHRQKSGYTFISRDAPIRPADNRHLTIGRLSADYRLIHKPNILTLIPKTVSIIQIFYCII